MEEKRMLPKLSPILLQRFSSALKKACISYTAIIISALYSPNTPSKDGKEISISSQSKAPCRSIREEGSAITWTDDRGFKKSAKDMIDYQMTYSQFLVREGEQIYLTYQSYSRYGDIKIIPIKCPNGIPSYEKILTYSLDPAFDEPQEEVRTGKEIIFANPLALAATTWDQILSQSESHLKLNNAKPVRLPNGNQTLAINVVKDGKPFGERQLVVLNGPLNLPSSTFCYSGCDDNNPDSLNKWVGLIDKHKVHGTLTVKANIISGTYRYERSHSDLFLHGTIDNGIVEMKECEDTLCSKSSGAFRGSMKDGHISGTWTSAKIRNQKLNFIMVSSTPFLIK